MWPAAPLLDPLIKYDLLPSVPPEER